MTSTMIMTQLFAADRGARQKIVDALHTASQSSKAKEPDLARYGICLPRDEADETLIYVFIEYVSQPAFSTLSNHPPAQDQLLSFFAANPSLFAAPPTIHTTHSSSSFTRPSLASAHDPYIAFAHMSYFENKRTGALEGWKTVTCATEVNELQTLGYGIYADREDETLIRTLEIYESEAFFRGTHMRNEAVWENRRKFGEGWRVPGKMGVGFLRVVGGFLGSDW